MQTALINATFFTGSEMVRDKALLITGGRIMGFSDPSLLPPGVTTIDCKGLLVTPGLIDLQIAGGGGFLFSTDRQPEALEAIVRQSSERYDRLSPGSSDKYREVLSSAFKTIRENPHPAVMGLHLRVRT